MMPDKNFWEWIVGLVLSGSPGWLMYFIHRWKNAKDTGAERQKVIDRLDMITDQLKKADEVFADHVRDDFQVTRQLAAMQRDIDVNFVRKDDLKEVKDAMIRLESKLDRLFDRRAQS